MALALRTYTDHLQCDMVTDNRLLALFLMFGCQPRLPVNLLFLTVRWDENSRTTDEYVTSLYDKLKSVLASARDTAILEAQRQKWHYDHKGPGPPKLIISSWQRDFPVCPGMILPLELCSTK